MAKYKITRTRRVTIMTAEDLPVQGHRVYFTEASTGMSDYVEIPDAEYSGEKVKVLVSAQADRIVEVFSLED